MKKYIISRNRQGKTEYLVCSGAVIAFCADIKKAKVITGMTPARKIRSGSGIPGCSRWKIEDYKPA